MILVTGTAGKTGREVLQALHAKGEPLRALVHRPEQVDIVQSLGVQDAVVGDMASQADMARVFQGVRKVYHICPNVSPQEEAIGETVIAAATSAGVEHFVYHSVLHPQTKAMPHHWQKLRLEERLIACGLPFTILQPAVYMQNILAQRQAIGAQGVYPVPYPAKTRLSLVDLQDVAQAAARVLTEPGHEYATYQLAGTLGLSQDEVAACLSRRIGHPVAVEVIPLPEWEEQARARGLDDYQVAALIRMFRYYAQHGLPGNPRVLSWLLGRPPTTLESFLERAFP
jgi:uncharacterized protein YbjT (DUF2867 family)